MKFDDLGSFSQLLFVNQIVQRASLLRLRHIGGDAYRQDSNWSHVLRRPNHLPNSVVIKCTNPATSKSQSNCREMSESASDGRVLKGIEFLATLPVTEPVSLRVSDEHENDWRFGNEPLPPCRPCQLPLPFRVANHDDLIGLQVSSGRGRVYCLQNLLQRFVADWVGLVCPNRVSLFQHLKKLHLPRPLSNAHDFIFAAHQQ
jgi:hypothetical protein